MSGSCFRERSGLSCKFTHAWREELTEEDLQLRAHAREQNVCFQWLKNNCTRTHCKFEHRWPQEPEENACQPCPQEEEVDEEEYDDNHVEVEAAPSQSGDMYAWAQAVNQAANQQAQPAVYPTANPANLTLQVPAYTPHNSYAQVQQSPAQTPTYGSVNFVPVYSPNPTSVPPSPALSASPMPFLPNTLQSTAGMVRAPSPMPYAVMTPTLQRQTTPVMQRAPSPSPYVVSTPTNNAQPAFYQIPSVTYGQQMPPLQLNQVASYSNGSYYVMNQGTQLPAPYTGSGYESEQSVNGDPMSSGSSSASSDTDSIPAEAFDTELQGVDQDQGVELLEMGRRETMEVPKEEEPQEEKNLVNVSMTAEMKKQFELFQQWQESKKPTPAVNE